jgi:hypothetical protein
MNEVQVHYKRHGDIDVALSGIPRHLTVERAMVGFLFFQTYLLLKINAYTFSFLAHLLHIFWIHGPGVLVLVEPSYRYKLRCRCLCFLPATSLLYYTVHSFCELLRC